jgi:hypothetical protein
MIEFSSLESFQTIEAYTLNIASENTQFFDLDDLEEFQKKAIDKDIPLTPKLDKFLSPSAKETVGKFLLFELFQDIVSCVSYTDFGSQQSSSLLELKEFQNIINLNLKHRCFSEIQASSITSFSANQTIQVEDLNVSAKSEIQASSITSFSANQAIQVEDLNVSARSTIEVALSKSIYLLLKMIKDAENLSLMLPFIRSVRIRSAIFGSFLSLSRTVMQH